MSPSSLLHSIFDLHFSETSSNAHTNRWSLTFFQSTWSYQLSHLPKNLLYNSKLLISLKSSRKLLLLLVVVCLYWRFWGSWLVFLGWSEWIGRRRMVLSLFFFVLWVVEKWIFTFSSWVPLAVAVWATLQVKVLIFWSVRKTLWISGVCWNVCKIVCLFYGECVDFNNTSLKNGWKEMWIVAINSGSTE